MTRDQFLAHVRFSVERTIERVVDEALAQGYQEGWLDAQRMRASEVKSQRKRRARSASSREGGVEG